MMKIFDSIRKQTKPSIVNVDKEGLEKSHGVNAEGLTQQQLFKIKRFSLKTGLLFALDNWPIYVLYWLFELLKLFALIFKYMRVPAFIGTLVLLNWQLPKTEGFDNLLSIRYLFTSSERLELLGRNLGDTKNTVEVVLASICFLILLFFVYIVPSLIAAKFTDIFSVKIYEMVDFEGRERTFRSILIKLRSNTLYDAQSDNFISHLIPKIVLNIVCIGLVIGIIYFIPIGFTKIKDLLLLSFEKLRSA